MTDQLWLMTRIREEDCVVSDERPTPAQPPGHNPPFFVVVRGSVRVRTRLVDQIGSEVLCQFSKTSTGSVLWQQGGEGAGGYDLETI